MSFVFLYSFYSAEVCLMKHPRIEGATETYDKGWDGKYPASKKGHGDLHLREPSGIHGWLQGTLSLMCGEGAWLLVHHFGLSAWSLPTRRLSFQALIYTLVYEGCSVYLIVFYYTGNAWGNFANGLESSKPWWHEVKWLDAWIATVNLRPSTWTNWQVFLSSHSIRVIPRQSNPIGENFIFYFRWKWQLLFQCGIVYLRQWQSLFKYYPTPVRGKLESEVRFRPMKKQKFCLRLDTPYVTIPIQTTIYSKLQHAGHCHWYRWNELSEFISWQWLWNGLIQMWLLMHFKKYS